MPQGVRHLGVVTGWYSVRNSSLSLVVSMTTPGELNGVMLVKKMIFVLRVFGSNTTGARL